MEHSGISSTNDQDRIPIHPPSHATRAKITSHHIAPFHITAYQDHHAPVCLPVDLVVLIDRRSLIVFIIVVEMDRQRPRHPHGHRHHCRHPHLY